MGHLPQLDRDALERLRRAVKSIRQSRGSLPLSGLVTLAASRPSGTAITIDFQASRDLGHELIVVRMPALPRDPDDRRLAVLSPREREIAGLIASGFKNKEIAAQLSIARSTVKDHVHHILQKTGLRNRTAVAASVPGAAPSAARERRTPTLARPRGKRNPPLDG
jgi:DNA-binding NarL/FixJ family response regulator